VPSFGRKRDRRGLSPRGSVDAHGGLGLPSDRAERLIATPLAPLDLSPRSLFHAKPGALPEADARQTQMRRAALEDGKSQNLIQRRAAEINAAWSADAMRGSFVTAPWFKEKMK
jgi:hypothetical protein